jgi:hypothetical protein
MRMSYTSDWNNHMAKGREKRVIKRSEEEQQRALQEGQKFGADVERTLRPGYTEFATTGGYSPQLQEEIRQRGSSALASLYGDLQTRLGRQRAVQGGYAPGFGAQSAQLGRQYGEQLATGLRDTDIALQQAILQGKLAGLGGLGGMEQLRLAGMGLTDEQIARMLGIQGRMATQPGLFQNLLSAIGTGTGAYRAITGGGS